MGSIDELLEVVWRSVAATRSEKAVDLVPKACVISMLHDGHQLNDVVSKIFYPGKDVLCKFLVGGHLGLWRGNSDVSFVNTSTLRLRRTLVLENVGCFFGRVPETSVVHGRYAEVLSHSFDPSGDALLSGVMVGHDQGDLEPNIERRE